MIVRAVPTVDDLIAEHLWLVADAARYLKRLPCVKRLGRDECMSIGRFALFKAAKNYNPSGGASFRTYAAAAIRLTITREAVKNDRALGLRLVCPDVLEGVPTGERDERVLGQASKRRRRRLQRRLGIHEQN